MNLKVDIDRSPSPLQSEMHIEIPSPLMAETDGLMTDGETSPLSPGRGRHNALETQASIAVLEKPLQTEPGS